MSKQSQRSFSCKFNHDIKIQNNTAQNNVKQIQLFKNKIKTSFWRWFYHKTIKIIQFSLMWRTLMLKSPQTVDLTSHSGLLCATVSWYKRPRQQSLGTRGQQSHSTCCLLYESQGQVRVTTVPWYKRTTVTVPAVSWYKSRGQVTVTTVFQQKTS
jgi:hypothetical protein